MEERQQVVLVRSARSIKAADLLPANPGRASRVHALIDAFQLSSMLKIVGPVPLSKAELTEFHSDEYISHLFSSQPDESLSGSESDCEHGDGAGRSETDRLEEFGLLYDCPLVDGIEDHVRYVAGGTVTAAMSLVSGETQCAIHWEGGRHHCKRSQASGFCYVNDIVLGILKLQARFARVLYIDLDLHHGDGVQDAFLYSNKVTTLSIHHFDRGFYPNTGGSCDEGRGRGAGHSINVPLRRGATDARFVEVLKRVAGSVAASFKPGAVVVQCGCDGLAGDPHKILNLTADAFVESVRFIMGWNLPVLLLGGGGYNTPDCARCWTRLTALACGRDISSSEDIPEHEFLSEYAPVFDMSIDRRLVDDENTAESIDGIVQQISALTR